MFELLGSDPWILVLIVITAFLASVVHGTVGLAGGLIMAAVISHFIGIKAAVPVVTCALIFSHFSRGFMLKKDIDWWAVRHVLLFGTPTIVMGAIVFGYLSQQAISIIFGSVLIFSLPIKYWAKRHSIKTGPKLLAAASSVWGMLAGNVIGPGFFLSPFLLGTGMNRLTFVGTLATITLAMNLIKISVFGVTALVTADLIILGVVAGIATIPGNMVGQMVLRKITDGVHGKAVDVMTLALVVNFFYLAFSG